MTSNKPRCDVITSHSRRFDVITTPCACWISFYWICAGWLAAQNLRSLHKRHHPKFWRKKRISYLGSCQVSQNKRVHLRWAEILFLSFSFRFVLLKPVNRVKTSWFYLCWNRRPLMPQVGLVNSFNLSLYPQTVCEVRQVMTITNGLRAWYSKNDPV